MAVDRNAYRGWLRPRPEMPWRLVCASHCERTCLELLEIEALRFAPAPSLRILPKGQIPAGEAVFFLKEVE